MDKDQALFGLNPGFRVDSHAFEGRMAFFGELPNLQITLMRLR